MISERALKKWRKEAFEVPDALSLEMGFKKDILEIYKLTIKTFSIHILKMTQELLDLHLTRKK